MEKGPEQWGAVEKKIENINHPELQEGEVFLANADDETFEEYGWSTKRAGHTAYDVDGKVIEDMFPIFVKKEEMDKENEELEK